MAEDHQEESTPTLYTWTGVSAKRADFENAPDVLWIEIELLRYTASRSSDEYSVLNLIVPSDRILSDLEDFAKTVKAELEK